jgi:ribosomal protein L37AE/L43A
MTDDHTNTCPLCGGHEIVPITKKKAWLWACRPCKKCWNVELWDALMNPNPLQSNPLQRSLEDFIIEGQK